MATATRGPCSPWDPVWCCPLDTSSAMATGTAVEIATEILYNMSGQIFDLCEFTIRPCRQNCADFDQWASLGWLGGGWLGGMYPLPALIGGSWFNLTCGSCSGSCSCTPLSEALMPSPVHEILSVKLDGQTMPASAYRVDDFRKLMRIDGGEWPLCQDLNAADDQPNTWSVTLTVGEAVPMLGRLAVGELACEIRRFCAGEECRIPRTARTVTRQGITIDVPTIQEMLREGFLGLQWSDTFINTYNPQRLKAPPLVYDVDGENYRRVGT